MSIVGTLHSKLIYQRRIDQIVRQLLPLIPPNSTVLDIGCGDGLIDSIIMKQRQDITIKGVDVLDRKQSHIPVSMFDGVTVPHADNSFDCILFVDVLHHTVDPRILLAEACRVSRGMILIKDHLGNSALDRFILRLMDWAGNAHHGVNTPYTFWSNQQWQAAFQSLQLTPAFWETKLSLYSMPTSLIFDRSLHFITQLQKQSA